MNIDFSEIEKLLSGYLSGELSDKDRKIVDEWRKQSPENEEYFNSSLLAWDAMPMLHDMEQFNSFEALEKVHARLAEPQSTMWRNKLQRIAAILLLPVLVYTGYITIQNYTYFKDKNEQQVFETISSRQGMVSQFALSDGTKVWLNSGSELQFPTHFSGKRRDVKLKGEAFFEVTKNKNMPFRVNAKDLNIEVLGTSFNVISYDDERQSEVILVEGKVKLTAQGDRVQKNFGTMEPGQRAIYNENQKSVVLQNVEVDKYVAWRDGNLMFRDDNMEEVAKRLSRWFNIEIVINDPNIRNYVYRATFRNENLKQVLNLLKISAPIDYEIIENKMLPNGEYTKQKVYIMSKK